MPSRITSKIWLLPKGGRKLLFMVNTLWKTLFSIPGDAEHRPSRRQKIPVFN